MRKRYPTFAAAEREAEAIGRLYAASVGKPWPMPPDSYGPGRQPDRPDAYYERYYRPPMRALTASQAPDGVPVPNHVVVDAFVQSTHGQSVRVTDGTLVTLDWSVVEPIPPVTVPPIPPVPVPPVS